MPTQLQLEGPELEPLLDRVRNELGAQARIIQAEKVRTGGVAGFFARQRFELTVEVPEDAAAPAGARTPGRPAAALPAAPTPSRTPAAPATSAPAAAPARPQTAAPATSLLDLVDQVEADEQSAAVSTESPTFATLLSRLGSAIGGNAEAERSPAPAPAVEAVPLPARAAAVPAPVAAAGSAVATMPHQRRSYDAPREVATRPRVTEDTTAVAVVHELSARALPETAFSRELGRLGLPVHLRPQVSPEQLHPALVQTLRTELPKVPRTPNRAGAVLVVVGPLALALDVAREMAQELGLPVGRSVLLATTARGTTGLAERQVLRSAAVAAERRVTWKRRSNLTIVAVDAALSSAGAAQARAFLAALDPTATWGVVEATRKAHDVGTWTRALGGVHALALTSLEETSDPASVLELGIPVSRLGSRPATPAAWASLLTGRLAA